MPKSVLSLQSLSSSQISGRQMRRQFRGVRQGQLPGGFSVSYINVPEIRDSLSTAALLRYARSYINNPESFTCSRGRAVPTRQSLNVMLLRAASTRRYKLVSDLAKFASGHRSALAEIVASCLGDDAWDFPYQAGAHRNQDHRIPLLGQNLDLLRALHRLRAQFPAVVAAQPELADRVNTLRSFVSECLRTGQVSGSELEGPVTPGPCSCAYAGSRAVRIHTRQLSPAERLMYEGLARSLLLPQALPAYRQDLDRDRVTALLERTINRYAVRPSSRGNDYLVVSYRRGLDDDPHHILCENTLAGVQRVGRLIARLGLRPLER